MRAPTPTNEAERLAVLLSCEVLDTAAEPSFDDIARLAGQLCNTPIALVSLVDRDRQWFKASVGVGPSETGRDASFCAHALASPNALVVPDTLADPRFVDNPLVTGDPNIRFYAGVPLEIDVGIAVGTLCVLDRVPRELSRVQLDALTALARQVTVELRLRRDAASWRHLTPVASPSAACTIEGKLVAGRYRIERVLGVGGMGIVVEAYDETEATPVAIKFLHSETQQRPEVQERFVREARAALRVGGDQIARVLDVGNLGNGAPFIVMEHLQGKDLEAHLEAAGRLPITEAVDIAREVCVAVGRVHAAGVLHRDLKPANVFLSTRPDGTGIVKILDFGISKFSRPGTSQDEASLTADADAMGSPSYMSPEQMRGLPDLDGRTDVWSLGVILYELLTGELPFPGSSVPAVCALVLTATPRPLRELRPEVSPALALVVARCLEREREARYPTIDAFSDALAPFGAPPSERALSVPPDPPVGSPQRRRTPGTARWPTWPLVVLLALLLVSVLLIMASTHVGA